MSEEKVALGRRLFFEPRLSITGGYSCASCHDPARSFSDGRRVAIGATGETLPHSAMALVNVAYNVSFGWTKPELRTLEAQMLEPLLNEHPVELGLAGRQESMVKVMRSDPGYAQAFVLAFGHAPVTFDHIVKAIAAFERTLISGNSAFDRYVFNGEHGALSPAAKRGMSLFFSARAGCSACHSGFNFAGNWRDSQGETGATSFASNGVSPQPMRVPTLRNIALTAPYMHDGRFATLDSVLDHYARVAQSARRESPPNTDRRLRTFDLNSTERADLVAFLRSLTDLSIAHPGDSRTVGDRNVLRLSGHPGEPGAQ